MFKKLTTEEFIQRAIQVHGNKYNYSKTEYINKRTKIQIICPKHGEFLQLPDNHLRGSGCFECGKINIKNKNTLTQSEFIQKSLDIHGDKYDYSKANYINALTKIEIICLEHGPFSQLPTHHLRGCGCPKCNNKRKSKDFLFTQGQWLQKAQEIHGDKYDYSLVRYKNSRSKVIIICKECNIEFKQIANTHLRGNGCNICRYKYMPQNQSLTTEEFIEKANKIHNNKYDYSKTIYINGKKFINIICYQHGVFKQRGASHLQGFGCPKCSASKGEKQIQFYLDKNKIKYNIQYKFKDCVYRSSLPFDFYLPDSNICIEFDGIQHYKLIEYFGGIKNFELIQLKDSIKTKYCLDNNIKLIRISYLEFDNIEKILEKAIK